MTLLITSQTHLLANSSIVDVETLWITNTCFWHFQVVQEEEPSKKRYRMDLQRHLSLDLEREPVLDDSAEEGSEFESAAIREIFGPSSHQEKPGKSSGGISLDINATPDPSTPAESMSNGSRGHDPEAVSLSPPLYQQPLNLSAVLHVVYKCLEDQFGEDVFEEKADCIQGGSLRINCSPDNVADFQSDKGSSSHPDDDRKIPIVVLACKWGADAEVLANRSLGILRRLKLKL